MFDLVMLLDFVGVFGFVEWLNKCFVFYVIFKEKEKRGKEKVFENGSDWDLGKEKWRRGEEG